MKQDFKELDIDLLKPNPQQSRVIFEEEKLKELALDIKNDGLRQPIDVILYPNTEDYYIVAGERRHRATLLNKQKKIKALIRYPNEVEAKQILLKGMRSENALSVALDSVETAISYRKSLRDVSNSQDTTLRFKTIADLAKFDLGFNSVENLNEEDKKIYFNKTKVISKNIKRFAKTTNTIEDTIEKKNGSENSYLLYKVAQIAIDNDLLPLSYGKKRAEEHIKNKKDYPQEFRKNSYNKYLEHTETLTRAEALAKLTQEEQNASLLYENQLKEEQIGINKFYLSVNETLSTNKDLSNIEIKSIIDKAHLFALLKSKKNKKTTDKTTKKYKQISAIIKNNGRNVSISMDIAKIPQEKKQQVLETFNKLTEQLEKIVNELTKRRV